MLLLCAVATAGLVAQVVSVEYEAVLRLYARGERSAALDALVGWPPSDLDRQVRALQRAARAGPPCPSCPDPLEGLPLKAAVMLHADRDVADRPPATGNEQPRLCPAEGAQRAGRIAALLAARGPTRDFARRFFLAMAHHAQWDFCLEAALQWGRNGLDLFPQDPMLLLAVGATLEEQASLGAVPGAAWAERARRFREAERTLALAITADPGLAEARVRLGRVQWRLGTDDQAQQTLEEAIRRGGPPQMQYLAHLFLGQAHERVGRLPAAIREFQECLDLEPQSQAAAVALSHALLLQGDHARARDVMRSALGHAGRRTDRDPHWDYVASNAASAGDLWEMLRRETAE